MDDQPTRTVETSSKYLAFVAILVACGVVALKLFRAWPQKFPNLAGPSQTACQFMQAWTTGSPVTGTFNDATGLPTVLLAEHYLIRGAAETATTQACTQLQELAASNANSVGVIVVILVAGLPLFCAALLHILTGSWRAGLLPAWLVAIFEQFTSAVSYGMLDNVLSSGIFAVATLCLAFAARFGRIVPAVAAGLLFAATAAFGSQINLLVPLLMAVALGITGMARSQDRRVAWLTALGLFAGWAPAAVAIITINAAATNRYLVLTNYDLSAASQRLGIAALGENREFPQVSWPTPPASSANVGPSQDIFQGLLRSDDRVASLVGLYGSEMVVRPLQFVFETLALSAQTFWRHGYFFFLVALYYLPVSWRIARARGMLPCLMAAILAPALLVLLNGIFANGHWVLSLSAVIPIVVIPGHVWRGM